jgi:amidohydrolase
MTNDWQARVDAAVDGVFDRMVALRRHLHAHPEPSGEELQTSLHLYQLLSAEDLPLRMGPEGRGVVVDAREEAPVRVAMRADIDGLRIADAKSVEYRSQTPGVMHACGHDAHTATLFGAIVSLDQLRQQGHLPCRLAWRGIFQPAEETATGALDMTRAGVLDGVNAIFSMHVDPTRRAGHIGIRSGVFTANCDAVRITVRGRGGHAARPHESNDPIAAAAQLISTLYQFVPRTTDSQEAVVVSIGQIHGGENANVIPEQVELEGTLRTLDRTIREQSVQQIRRLARGIEAVTGTSIEVCFEVSIPSVYNDGALTAIVARAASDLVGSERVEAMPRPSMGSEDFAIYLQDVPGTMFRLGCAGDLATQTGLHTPLFDVDERCLAIGAKLLARSVVQWALQHEK